MEHQSSGMSAGDTPASQPPGAPDWRGSMGAVWARHLARFESMLQHSTEAAVAHAAPQPGERILDIGCGGGPTTIALARAVGPRGRVTGVDICPVLASHASQRLVDEGVENAQVIEADAAALDPGLGEFDCLFSRFGVMFFEDLAGALSGLRQRLRPGGRVRFMVWAPPKRNPWIADLMQVAARHIQVPTPDLSRPGMFGCADQTHVAVSFMQAGFSHVHFDEWEGTQWVAGRGTDVDAALEFVLEATPIGDLAADYPDDVKAQLGADLRAFLETHATDAGIPRPGTAWLIHAEAQEDDA